MIRVGEKSQAEIAELFNVDRSTISRMMKEVREKGTAEGSTLNRDSPALTPGVTIDNGDERGCTASSMFLSHSMSICFFD
jgi:DNA-binding Lrp family transcriptional regulator